MKSSYDVIVIGAGHAGIEAALASSRMGSSTLIVTLNKETIGLMSCNPAIGGVGKGQLVKEVDALGGQMAQSADACGIQFRILNASKGPAVQSSRAQIDKDLYAEFMRKVLESQADLFIKEAEVSRLLIRDNSVCGIATAEGEEINSKSVVIATGTFLEGLIHVGLRHFEGGRIGEKSSVGLAECLKKLGFKFLRFKTGTCPRVEKQSIDFSDLKIQEGDEPPPAFSFSTKEIKQSRLDCFITYTNQKTHKIIRDNLDKSPLYAGIIKATGVRYCPSIEDKVVKFSDRGRHQVFLEPEGRGSRQVYLNGLSTSLPEEVQLEMLHSIDGLKDARVVRFGYGIEHDVVEPTQLFPTLETKSIGNLYLAGQINGTTGYEEAAAQGLIAGINASLRSKKKPPFILDRGTSYIGVLIDDLTTRGTQEPYRMFTSRVEYRLILREDNADLRLAKMGHDIGLVSEMRYKKAQEKIEGIKKGMDILRVNRLKPSEGINSMLKRLNSSPLKKSATLEDILRRPGVNLKDLMELCPGGFGIPDFALKQIEIEVKYAGFIRRQEQEVDRFKNLEKIKLPDSLDYELISGLSREIKEKLKKFKPLNLGQASRISGVTPVSISILMVYLRKLNAERRKLS